tara:strand:+ start:892 stop:2187 length:1296 start_codon:yes stop_codon:yes gene_type:complete
MGESYTHINIKDIPDELLEYIGEPGAILNIYPQQKFYEMVKKYIGTKNNINLVSEITGPYSFEDEEEDEMNDNGVHKPPVFNLTIKSKKIFKFISGQGMHKTKWNSTVIWVYERTVGNPFPSSKHPYGETYKYISIIVNKPHNQKTLKSFVEHLIDLHENTNKNTYNIYIACDSYAMWDLLKKSPKRKIESVILPSSQKEEIIDDLTEFISDKTAEWYSDHGIPYKKVYLFHGDPGCGKSSLIGAIASHFNMNVCFLQSNFRDMTDNFLTDLAHRVPSNSIMVMEDVDSLFNNHRENDHESSLTFSGVINMLDGLSCPFGQIIIMTTNHYDQLDTAMVRDSRIDKIIEIKKPGKDEIKQIFNSFYPIASEQQKEDFASFFISHRPSMASIQTVFIDYRRKGFDSLIEDLKNDNISLRKNQSPNSPIDSIYS